MAYPSDVAAAQTGHVTDHNVMRDDITRLMGKNSGSRSYAGMVYLDDPRFTGSTDDAKLASAMSYCGAQTYVPLIGLGTRDHTFSTPLGQAYDGFGLVGANRGWGNAETGHYRTRVNLTIGANSFLDVTSSEAWNWYLEGFDVRGSSTATLVTSSGAGAVLWASTFRNLTVQSIKGVFGNSSSKLLTDLITIDGQWEILNCQDTYVNIGGADNRGIFTDGGNFGCGSTTGSGKYQMIFAGLSKSYIGPVYITADSGWRGMKFTGSMGSGYGVTVLPGAIVEGRNNGSPCDGNLVLITGGNVNIRDMNVNCGMASPSAGEHGLIEINGTDAQVVLDGINCGGHTSTAGAATPVVYVTGTSFPSTSVRCSNFSRGQRASTATWGSQMPVVSQTNTGLLKIDDSVVLV